MTKDTPRAQNFRQPAEWAPHEAVWLAWPSHADLWQEDLEKAQEEFTGLARSLAEHERLEVLVPDSRAKKAAERALQGLNARFHEIPFGDIWLRDTGPIFLLGPGDDLAAVRFRFNGWGEKYILPHDTEVSAGISRAADVGTFSFPWILEGGSVDVDGEGTCLTTRQCLLNPNRNEGMTQVDIESGLREGLGVEKILWLNDGLLNDHTDGHVDTIARFVAPGIVVCMEARDADDPNRAVMDRIASDLARMTDARGRNLEVVRIPSPGRILDEEGEVMPASYVNFYIGNKTVVVPVYGSAHDQDAVAAIARCFPGRRTVGLPAKAILTGGGAFHCISQQQPAAKAKRSSS